MSNRIHEGTSVPPVGWYRWGICALLFLATTLNYIDRQVIGILKPELAEQLGWNEIDYSNIVFAFQIAYAIGYVGAGWFIDRVGVKLGYAIAVLCWSLAEMTHALNWFIPAGAKLGDWLSLDPEVTRVWLLAMPATVLGFCVARFTLGVAEGGNFPAAIKTVSEWFPRKERALSTGIFNAGSNVGALAAPLLVPWLTVALGWPMAFLVTGRIRHGMVCSVVAVLPKPRKTSTPFFGRTGLHPQRPAGPRCSNSLADIAALSPNMGLHPRDRSEWANMVVLSVLDSGFPTQAARPESAAVGSATGGYLPYCRCG